MTDNTQPDSGSTHIIRFALELGLLWIDGDGRDKVREALDALDILESQLSSSGFTAADMATASAQGFRDGAASVAASAGSEPVAWQYRSVRDKGPWFDCTEERAKQRAAHPETWDVRYLYTHPAPQPAPVAQGDALDAARYRWLRNKSTVLHNTAWLGGATAVQRDVDFLRRDDALAALDAAIDAARKQGANHD